MRIEPDLKKVRQYAASGEYNILPLSCEIMSDFTTPIETLRVLKSISKHCFLLESVSINNTWGRYSFLGFEPRMRISCENGFIKTSNRQVKIDDPSKEIRRFLENYRSPVLENLPPFTGGLVGYFSNEYLGYTEHSARRDMDYTEVFKDADFMFFDNVIVFDHLKNKIIIIVNMNLLNVDTNYAKAQNDLRLLTQIIKKGKKDEKQAGKKRGSVTALYSKDQFCDMVEKAQKNICEGDVTQLVLSNRLSVTFEGSLLNTYRVLRTINPSPYMFYFSGTDIEMAGASPQTLVKFRNGTADMFLVAGVRPRGHTYGEDIHYEEELLKDNMKLAENKRLADLACEDLEKVTCSGTVNIEKAQIIERFSNVMHMGTWVSGKVADGFDALNVIESVLPAGMQSGVPKIKACKLITELENNRRGIYGGAIGYIGFTGNMDTCMGISNVYRKNMKAYFRGGVSITADSIPKRAFEECMNNAKTALRSLEIAQEAE